MSFLEIQTTPASVTSAGEGTMANDDKSRSKMPQPSMLTGTGVSLDNESMHASNPIEEEI